MGKGLSCPFVSDPVEKQKCQAAVTGIDTAQDEGCKIALQAICNVDNCPENKFSKTCKAIKTYLLF